MTSNLKLQESEAASSGRPRRVAYEHCMVIGVMQDKVRWRRRNWAIDFSIASACISGGCTTPSTSVESVEIYISTIYR